MDFALHCGSRKIVKWWLSVAAIASKVCAAMNAHPSYGQHQRVCAVVVTYNRKDVLAGCLEALLKQSYWLDRIVVVDNASIDATAEFLRELAEKDKRVSHALLPANTGGAGGFHEGFKRALALHPDWIWAMDDDGLPAHDALQRLVEAPAAAGQFRGPVVLARERISDPDNDQLAFAGGIDTASGTVALRTRADLEAHAQDGIVPGYACVFNGVLIHREAAERIGLPKKEFFIWGDEWDYIFRARRLDVPMATVNAALYWHPADRTQHTTVRFLGKEYDVPFADGAARNYLLIRNYAYLASRHRGLVAWVRHTIKYLLFHASARGCFTPWQVLRYSFEGLAGRFDGPGPF